MAESDSLARKAELSAEDLDYSSDCRAMLAREKMRLPNALLWLTILFFVGGGVWAYFAEIEEVTRGQGKVIPSSSVQRIQSLEGGILETLNVAEGDTVEKGDILLKINDVIYAATYQESVEKRDVLSARMVRLKAESAMDKTLEFPEEIKKSRPDLVKSETELFEKRKTNLEGTLGTLQKSLALATEEYDLMKPKLGRGVSKIEVLRVERDVNELTGDIENRKSQFQKQALEEFDAAKAELASLRESIKGYEDRVSRTEVRSPVRGTVNKIHIDTVGRVIKAGEDIMDIVPLEDSLLIETNIRPADIAFLHPGQEALVKFTAYDFTRYGGLKGKVEQIGVDTIQNENGESYFQIKIRTDEDSLGVNETGEQLDIIPGMVVEIDIMTGTKTVLEYLLNPINRARQRAFRER